LDHPLFSLPLLLALKFKSTKLDPPEKETDFNLRRLKKKRRAGELFVFAFQLSDVSDAL